MNFINSIVKTVRGIVKLYGGTDDTIIGNVSDALRVYLAASAPGSTTIGTDLRYYDMNNSNGGVARQTIISNAAFVNLFNKTGAGLVFSWSITIEEPGQKWDLQFTVDGVDIFPSGGIPVIDIDSDSLYALESDQSRHHWMGGLSNNFGKSIRWSAPAGFPLVYTSTVVVKIKRSAGESSKKFLAGIISISGA